MDQVAVERIATGCYQIDYQRQVMTMDSQALRDLYDILLRRIALIEDEAVARAEAVMLLWDCEPR